MIMPEPALLRPRQSTPEAPPPGHRQSTNWYIRGGALEEEDSTWLEQLHMLQAAHKHTVTHIQVVAHT